MAGKLESNATKLEGQQTFCGSQFPLVYRASEPAVDWETVVAWIRGNRTRLLAELADSGAILFRNFGIRTDLDFDGFVRAFEFDNFPYSESFSNAVRINRTERVFTANEAPADVNIFFHHELAQTPLFPERIFFFCEQAAESGGQTPICRSDILLERLRAELPDFVDRCEKLGLRYSNVMPETDDPASGMGRSWKSTLGTDSRSQAEQKLASFGYTFEWQDDGALRMTTPVVPAVRELPDGRKTFFNQLIAAATGWKDERNDPTRAICFGDGSPLDFSGARTAASLAEPLAFDIPWQQGDVALVDNVLTMHARRTFTGTRRVLASLACPHRL